MLCLTRKPGQSVWVGDDIEIILDSIQARRIALISQDDGDVVRHHRMREGDSFEFRIGGDDVAVELLRVKPAGGEENGTVSLGFTAPRHITILRNELREAQGGASSA